MRDGILTQAEHSQQFQESLGSLQDAEDDQYLGKPNDGPS